MEPPPPPPHTHTPQLSRWAPLSGPSALFCCSGPRGGFIRRSRASALQVSSELGLFSSPPSLHQPPHPLSLVPCYPSCFRPAPLESISKKSSKVPSLEQRSGSCKRLPILGPPSLLPLPPVFLPTPGPLHTLPPSRRAYPAVTHKALASLFQCHRIRRVSAEPFILKCHLAPLPVPVPSPAFYQTA